MTTSFTSERDPFPASQYLQEKLQERRARNIRPHRSRHTDFGPRPSGCDDDIFLAEAEATRASKAFDSSPIAYRPRGSDAGNGSGSGSRRRTLGVRDMDTQLDRLSKQNFALKLELDHRREQALKFQEQIEAMQEENERAERLVEEHSELLKINSQLVEELEKRDRAVEEAMDIICDLEEKLTDLEERRSSVTRPSTAQADSGYAGTETQEQVPPSSPPGQVTPKTPHVVRASVAQPGSTTAASAKLQGIMNGPSPAKIRREPLIFSQKRPSTRALRSVYQAASDQLHPVKSFQSLLSKQDSRADDASIDEVLNSPRLSVLSESSIASIYSPKKLTSPDRYPWETSSHGLTDGPPSRSRGHLRQDSIKRVSQWISNGDLAHDTPSKSFALSQPLRDVTATPAIARPARVIEDPHYQSLNDALVAVAGEHPPSKSRTGENPYTSSARADSNSTKKKTSRPRPTSLAGPPFGESLVAPTPETTGAKLLRGSRSSIVDERSLLDTTPMPVKGYTTLEPATRSAPRAMRSSVELGSSGARQRSQQALRPDFHDISSSDEDDAYDARLNPIANFGDDYDGYPDGKSIIMGTPSRFLKHPKALADVTFDGYDGASIMTARSPPRRRRSSVGPSQTPGKPRLSRVDTSPTIFHSFSRMVGNGNSTKASLESIASPRSVHSGSSGNRTIVRADEHPLPAPPSPELTRLKPLISPYSRSRASPSPARAFHSIFRRLSNSQGSDRPETGPHPAQQLPATPLSACVNNVPVDQRRPKTSDSSAKSITQNVNAASGVVAAAFGARRPSIPSRTKTDPPIRSASTVPPEDKDKKATLFRRSNSVRRAAASESETKNAAPLPLNASSAIVPQPAPTRMRSRSRRGSVRDAIAGSGRRPWNG